MLPRIIIYYTSDLHLLNKAHEQVCAKLIADAWVQYFIDLQSKEPDSLICLAGDICCSYTDTLSFVKRLDNSGVKGFFVMGNWEFDMNLEGDMKDTRPTERYPVLMERFRDVCKDNTSFKLLQTGVRYIEHGLTIIGDTGWRRTKTVNPKYGSESYYHKKWVAWANSVIDEGKPTLVITHHHMLKLVSGLSKFDLTDNLLNERNNINIFGHLHGLGGFKGNNYVSTDYVSTDYLEGFSVLSRVELSVVDGVLRVLEHSVAPPEEIYAVFIKLYKARSRKVQGFYNTRGI